MRVLALLTACLPLLLALAPESLAQNCANTSVGFTPINDLGPGTYQGFPGGLYPGGSNERPAAHTQAGVAEAGLVVPRDASGAPDPEGGKVVFVSIGMSNTRNHWQSFMQIAGSEPDLHPRLVLVQGAQGGQPANEINDPDAPYWDFVQQQVAGAGATNAQVQVIWMLQAHSHPTDPFPQSAETLRDDFITILGIVRDLFPNARLAYLASRIYAGYATTQLNPEPYAYENGFSVKWTVEEQLGGDPALNFDPDAGAVEAPWLSWGVYTWADGLMPRSDGLIWECPEDYAPDGTHPSPAGSLKVANMLMDQMKSDPTSTPWFLGEGGEEPTGVAYCFGDGTGEPCPCGNSGAPGHGCRNSAVPAGSRLGGQGTPSVSNDTVVLGANGLPEGTPVLFFQALNPAAGGQGIPFGDGLRCAGGGLVRLAIHFGTGGNAVYPEPGEPPISEKGALPPGGGTRHYQAWYRDSAPGFCTPATFNLSNGFRIQWAP